MSVETDLWYQVFHCHYVPTDLIVTQLPIKKQVILGVIPFSFRLSYSLLNFGLGSVQPKAGRGNKTL